MKERLSRLLNGFGTFHTNPSCHEDILYFSASGNDSESRPCRALLCAALLLAISANAQNVVDGRGDPERVVEPVALSEEECAIIFAPAVAARKEPLSAEAARVAAKLEVHVVEFINGWPWMPLHHTLGISGVELDFDHSAEIFYALTLAAPHLSRETSEKVRRLLDSLLDQSPPFAIEGLERTAGKPREAYDVPQMLRQRGRGRASSAFGVYAFWLFDSEFTADATPAHWSSIVQRMQPLLDARHPFDPSKRDYSHDEAQSLNGDLAGLIAFVRLAHRMNDAALEERARGRAIELARLRVNLERINPQIVEKTSAATKSLHNFKLARYCDLVPEVAALLRAHDGGLAAERLRSFREARNGWFMAFGDRLIGGENYTNPLHFPRALFAGAALIEQLPQDELLRFTDVPWCKGDIYFIEKCALALGAVRR